MIRNIKNCTKLVVWSVVSTASLVALVSALL